MPKGLIESDESLVLTSKTDRGWVYVDGPHLKREVALGGEVVFKRSSEMLNVLGFRTRS